MKYLLFFAIFFTITNTQLSYAEQIYYGQIINPDTYLYRDLNNNIIFQLPETYFVKLTGYTKGFYYAEYMNIRGYVKSSQIKVVREVPRNPYLTTSTFRLFSSDHNQLRTSPNISSNVITTLPINTKINYIATTLGQELISGRGNAWYYCSYTENQITVNGYIYAGLCDELQIIPNTQSIDPIPNPFISASTEYIEYLNDQGKMLILIPIIVISILFVPLLFLPKYISLNKRNKMSYISIEDGKL